jgi:DNA-directed RNA polymerase specialized sigma24 family protein
MQKADAYGRNDERDEIPRKERAQQLEQVLTNGLLPLYRRAYRILGNAADAVDAVQDALLAAYTHLHQLRGQAQISTWLTTIVLNCARLQLRRRPGHVHASLDGSSGELQPLSVSERIADHRPNPEDEYRESGRKQWVPVGGNYDLKSERRQQRGYEWVLIVSWLCALVLWGFTWWTAFRLLCSMVQFVQYVPRLLP